MACPICSAPESANVVAGIRAGAGVMILAVAIAVSAMARFAWRLWTLERRGA